MLARGKELAESFSWPLPGGKSGRYIPLFTASFAAVYAVFGFALHAYYTAGAVIMLASLFLICAITAAICGSRTAGVVSALLAVTASPVAENIYTLGKQEPKLLVFILAALYLLTRAFFRENSGKPDVTAANIIGSAFLILLGLLMKETAAAMIVFAAAGMVLSFLVRDTDASRKENVRAYSVFFAAVAAVIVLVKLFIWYFTPIGSKEVYTTYPITRELITANLTYYARQLPDVLLFYVLSTAVLAAAAWKRPAGSAHRIIFAASLLALAFGYAGGMLFWRWPLGYYMLVPAVLLPIVLVSGVWMSRSIRGSRLLLGSLVALVVLSRLYSIPYGVYVVGMQKTADCLFTEAIGAYAEKAVDGERLLVEEWPFYNEQVMQSNILVRDIYGRKGLRVEGINDLLNIRETSSDTLILFGVGELPAREPRLPRKGDYLLVLDCENPSSWVVRGVSHCDDAAMISEGRGLELVSQRKIAWKGIQAEAPGFSPKLRNYRKEYRLYKIRDWKMISWRGRWADGWIGRNADCTIQAGDGARRAVFSGEAYGQPVPLTLDVSVDSVRHVAVRIEQPGPFTLVVDLGGVPATRDAVISFSADRVFVPQANDISDDRRALSVRITGVRLASSAD
ncbi:MAG: hypothetical protein OHK006_21300 [Thermodesulfovibrionales bacterium]